MTLERIERRTLHEDDLRQLRELFPDVLLDGRVNLARLRELLEGEVELADEHYGLNWPGKQSARRQAARPPSGSLRVTKGEGVNEGDTKNLLVIGDNLEVLRLMEKSYANRIKLIYIDPPYNTGNDFIYKDDFKDPVVTYLEATGQSDFAGLLTSNPRSSGRHHSNWLTFIYPRLVLARRMLRDDGAIFVTIDDNELYNLRLVMDEIFGPENFIANVIWQKVFAVKNSAEHFSGSHDYLMVYARNADQWDRKLLPRTTEQLGDYKNPDNDPRGVWNSVALSARNPYSEGLWGCTTPSGRVIEGPPKGRYWAVSYAKFQAMDKDNRIWWGKEKDGIPRQKVFLTEVQQGIVPDTIWTHDDAGNTQEAKKELLARVPFESSATVFDTPKPTRLIEKILRLSTSVDSRDIVLDFFAGSGTTGEAVMKLNREDGGNRRFILVQLPEVTGHNDYKTIAEITKTRLRNGAKSLAEQSQLTTSTFRLDLGFRVLREDKTSVARWLPYEGADPQALPGLFRSHNGLVSGWKAEDLLIEVMLLEGYPLDSAQAQSPQFLENVVYSVEHESIPTRLLVCLDAEIADGTVDLLAEFEKDVFVCCESALTDTLKVRIADALHRVRTL